VLWPPFSRRGLMFFTRWADGGLSSQPNKRRRKARGGSGRSGQLFFVVRQRFAPALWLPSKAGARKAHTASAAAFRPARLFPPKSASAGAKSSRSVFSMAMNMSLASGRSDWVTAGGLKLEVRARAARPAETRTIVALHEGLGSIGMRRNFPADRKYNINI